MNAQGKILSFFGQPFFTKEHAGLLREDYFIEGAAKEAYILGSKAFLADGLCNWSLVASKAPEHVTRYIQAHVTPEYEIDFPGWLTALKDEYLTREYRQTIQATHISGIDAVYETGARMAELLELVKTQEHENLSDNFKRFLAGEFGDPIPTGFPKFDREIMNGGLFPGQYVVIGGDPGTGKTSFMLNMAYNQAKDEDIDFHSYELVPQELHRRLVSSRSGIDGRQLLRRELTAIERTNAENVSERIQASRLNLPKVRGGLPELEMAIKTSRARVIYVDYLQHIPMPGNRPEHEKIRQISNTLNAAIKETGKCMVIASSLNNEAMKSGKTSMTDFKSSGDISYDADLAIILKFTDGSPDLIRAVTEKNRNGIRATIQFKFDMPCFRYMELEEYRDENLF